ncbi:MAG: preprotein translocase subunit SecY [Verrucomicrobiota bacterium]
MISAFTNTFKIPELRQRILFTLAMIVIVRVGAAITLPGVDAAVLHEAIDASKENLGNNPIGGLMNIFSGGGLTNCAVFALGIMPYISASIMMQLLSAVVPQLQKLSREDGGRQKITMYTRYVTIALCVLQGGMLANSLQDPSKNIFLQGFAGEIANTGKDLVPGFGWEFVTITVITITAGCMLLMWLGEQITERGIGNGISIIICVNIVSALPGALVQAWDMFVTRATEDPMRPVQLVLLIAFLLIVVAGVIAITQAQRRISIQYAKRVVGRKVYGGQSTFLPLKVNYAGVMPIIFAQAILLFPGQILQFMFQESTFVDRINEWLSPSHWFYYVISGLLIFFFSYFWVATMFQPNQIAEDLKKNGGYIPGVRPGKPTAEFLDYTMGRLTFAGALFLTVIAIIPSAISTMMKINYNVSQFFGGTSILILVGVILDVMRQAETHLLQRHYDGFLRKGKIRGRFDRRQRSGKVASSSTMIWLYFVLGVLLIVGVAYHFATR